MEPPEIRRIAFTVHYDGGAYFGWQLQKGQRSVQGEIEAVLSRLFDRPARVLGSGRTDRGVHAVGQVASVDAPAKWAPESLERAMNALLPTEVRIFGALAVDPNFHPRYSAVSRSYIYRVGTGRFAESPFHSRWCWALGLPLDVEPMNVAARSLEGDHSFRAFAKAGQEERGDRCIVTAAGWKEWSDLGMEFHISANRFLHHMVRYIVGTSVEIGLGRRPAGDLADLLAGAAELRTSPPAPPQGLFLSRVDYPTGTYAPDQATAMRPIRILEQ